MISKDLEEMQIEALKASTRKRTRNKVTKYPLNLNIRVSEGDLKAWKGKAALMGLSLSHYIRYIMNGKK